MTEEDRMDKQFEAWFRKEYQLEADDDINFSNGEVRMMLKGWRASREAVEVYLPKPSLLIHLDAQKFYRRQVSESIRSQGLKVKP